MPKRRNAPAISNTATRPELPPFSVRLTLSIACWLFHPVVVLPSAHAVRRCQLIGSLDVPPSAQHALADEVLVLVEHEPPLFAAASTGAGESAHRTHFIGYLTNHAVTIMLCESHRIRQDCRVIEHADRPWGAYTVLAEAEDFKVKTIEVQPGQRLSYQRHSRRSEHWFVVAGEGIVTLDGESIDVRRGDAVDVPLGMAHRIHNTGHVRLVFVEVQHGDYVGEDDIVRLDDDYGRSPPRSALGGDSPQLFDP
jgi:mannose-6-phosphate isomerase